VFRAAAFVVFAAAVGGCSSSGAKSEAAADVADAGTGEAGPMSDEAAVSGKAPSGTLVMLEPLFPHESPVNTQPAYMDQSGLAFIPEFLAVNAGQAVHFRNNEDVLHNVRVQEKEAGVPVFNVATTPYNSYVYTFEKAGYYDVSCDIHASMQSTVLVTSAPHVVTADGAGQFAFAGVVPGQYKATWFENGEERHKQVQIVAPRAHIVLP
jgi:plastocyanin